MVIVKDLYIILLFRLVYVLIAITCIVTWPISKVLDCLLGSDQGTFYKRSQFKVLVDLHADDGCSENGLEEPFTQDEVRIIKVPNVFHVSKACDNF